MSKRLRKVDDEGNHPTPLHSLTAAAKFNRMTLKKLEKELQADPELDLTSILPSNYSRRLAQMKHQENEIISISQAPVPTASVSVVNPNLAIHTSVEHLPKFIFRLSDIICDLLEISSVRDERTSWKLLRSLPRLLQAGEVLWRSKICPDNAVIKCSSEIVVKVVPNIEDHTEFTSLQYIADNIREVPTPKPHGLIEIGDLSYTFMSFIEGTTLDKAWPNMISNQKNSIKQQLNKIFLKMRQHRRPNNAPLGGVSGEGCKDTRRHTRVSKARIYDSSQFEDFQFAEPSFGGEAYIGFLRSLLSDSKPLYVFTHGDLRKENVMVRFQDDGEFKVTGVIDWEKSGFYPEYFECTKITSTMSPSETDDWYLYLPPCISPKLHPARWLLDRLWDKHIS